MGKCCRAARQLFDTDGRLVFNSFPESPVADTVITYNDDQGTVVQERDGMQASTLFVSLNNANLVLVLS